MIDFDDRDFDDRDFVLSYELGQMARYLRLMNSSLTQELDELEAQYKQDIEKVTKNDIESYSY